MCQRSSIDVIERMYDEIRVCIAKFGVFVEACDSERVHAPRFCCDNAGDGVFNDNAIIRGDVQFFCGSDKNIRVWFSVGHVATRHIGSK